MSDIVKEYSNKDLTVIWKPKQCIHSEKCFHGLSSVFDPNNRPWVNVEGASSSEIKEQIDKCPSGALSYKLINENLEDKPKTEEESLVEVIENGPLMVHGDIKVRKADQSEISKGKVTAFCRCGASDNKPFCDGSHKKMDFKG